MCYSSNTHRFLLRQWWKRCDFASPSRSQDRTHPFSAPQKLVSESWQYHLLTQGTSAGINETTILVYAANPNGRSNSSASVGTLGEDGVPEWEGGFWKSYRIHFKCLKKWLFWGGKLPVLRVPWFRDILVLFKVSIHIRNAWYLGFVLPFSAGEPGSPILRYEKILRGDLYSWLRIPEHL